MNERISVRAVTERVCVQRLGRSVACMFFVVASSVIFNTGLATADTVVPEIDGVYVVTGERPTRLSATALDTSALLQLIASEPAASTASTTDAPATHTVVRLYVRANSSQIPVLSCISVGSAGYSTAAVAPARLNATGDKTVWQTQCPVEPETGMVFVNLVPEAAAERNYLLAFKHTERILSAYLDRADLDMYFRTDMAALINRLYPEQRKARHTLANVSPFVRKHIAHAKQRLIGKSWDQYRKQEQHSYNLSMRNGVKGRGYRLQNYLRDYPSGRYAASVRLEILQRKKDLFLSKPRWAERRAENNLQIVLHWTDNQRKIDALRKYLVAYPNGRLVSLVRIEIGRVSNALGLDALSSQMTAENLTE